jgi:hypothetical protein
MSSQFCVALCAVLLAICPAGACWARLGETEAEIIKRYGQPTGTDSDPKNLGIAEKKLRFFKGDTHVVVLIFRGRSVMECYTFLGEQVTPVPVRNNLAKAEALLEASAQGEEWVRHPAPHLVRDDVLESWERSDGKAMAMVYLNRPETLEVSDVAYQREWNASEKRAKAGADGF